jgi:hypothetical protein
MKFVLLSGSHFLPDGNISSITKVVEYDSMTQLMEDLAQNSFWVAGENNAFKVEQVIPYSEAEKHLD